MDINGKVLEKVREYISADESYDDDAQITIDPESLEVGLVDGEGRRPCRQRRLLSGHGLCGDDRRRKVGSRYGSDSVRRGRVCRLTVV